MRSTNLFELFATITLDDSGYKKGLDDAVSHTSKLSDSIKSGLATAAKVGTAAITAAAAGIAALTKASVENYAEYEQLAGGAKKIFDQMDTSKIMTDAANAYKDLGLSMNQYLSVMNNVGATFAATMGDEAGYETAKIGLQAISDYASGTGKSVDELSEKFTLITRSTSSYQSIADQFSGILPATSKDFLEQAQAAGFLSESYTELTKVPVAEYQEAVSKMLEKGVEDLGLAGNTALEASTTLSGSLAMTKAAWSNLVTGVADDNADIGQLIDNFVGSVGTVFENLLPRIKAVFGKLGEIAKQGFTAIYNKFREFMDNCGILDEFDAIVAGITTAFTKVKNVFTTVWNKANEVFPKVKKSVTDSFDRIKEVLQPAIDFLGNIIEKIKEYFESGEAAEDITNTLSSVIEFLGNGLSALSDFLATVVEKIASFVTWLSEGSTGADILLSVITGLTAALIAHEVATKAVTAATLIMEGAQKAITVAQAALNAVMNANPFVLIATLIAGVVTALITLWNTNEDFRNAVIKIWDGIKNAFSTAWDFIKNVFGTVGDFFSGVWNNIKNVFANVGDWFGEKFSNAKEKVISAWDNIKEAFENIWKNIKDAFSDVGIWFTQTFAKARDAAVGVWKNAKTTFLDIWENIKSVFSDAFDVGKDIVDSIWNGITGAWDTVVKGVQGLWERFKATITGTDDTVSVAVDGSHYTGLDYVPYDGYIAELHKGEMVLTADEARGYDKGKFGSTVNITENIYVQGNYDDAAQRKNNARLANQLAR